MGERSTEDKLLMPSGEYIRSQSELALLQVTKDANGSAEFPVSDPVAESDGELKVRRITPEKLRLEANLGGLSYEEFELEEEVDTSKKKNRRLSARIGSAVFSILRSKSKASDGHHSSFRSSSDKPKRRLSARLSAAFTRKKSNAKEEEEFGGPKGKSSLSRRLSQSFTGMFKPKKKEETDEIQDEQILASTRVPVPSLTLQKLEEAADKEVRRGENRNMNEMPSILIDSAVKRELKAEIDKTERLTKAVSPIITETQLDILESEQDNAPKEKVEKHKKRRVKKKRKGHECLEKTGSTTVDVKDASLILKKTEQPALNSTPASQRAPLESVSSNIETPKQQPLHRKRSRKERHKRRKRTQEKTIEELNVEEMKEKDLSILDKSPKMKKPNIEQDNKDLGLPPPKKKFNIIEAQAEMILKPSKLRGLRKVEDTDKRNTLYRIFAGMNKNKNNGN